MADHYRTLVQSLMKLGFLFRRQGVRKHEVWRNRRTDQEVTFDRQAVSASRAAAAAVLKEAEACKPAAAAVQTSGKTAARRAGVAARAQPKAPVKRLAKASAKSKPVAKGKAKATARRSKTAARR
jgi:hypothetical protein